MTFHRASEVPRERGPSPHTARTVLFQRPVAVNILPMMMSHLQAHTVFPPAQLYDSTVKF